MNLALEYYVDPSSTHSNIELGTRAYPFKAIDDPFRELFTLAPLISGNSSLIVYIYLKQGSNLTIHSKQMPIVTLNS